MTVRLVCGPPGAGKSTLVREKRRDGDLVIDLDDIRASVGSEATARKLRSVMEDGARTHEDGDVWIVRTLGDPAARAEAIDPLETEVRDELLERLRRWRRRAPQHYWRHNAPGASLLQSAEDAAARRASGRTPGSAWPTPNTLRGVEPSTPYRLAERLRRSENAS